MRYTADPSKTKTLQEHTMPYRTARAAAGAAGDASQAAWLDHNGQHKFLIEEVQSHELKEYLCCRTGRIASDIARETGM